MYVPMLLAGFIINIHGGKFFLFNSLFSFYKVLIWLFIQLAVYHNDYRSLMLVCNKQNSIVISMTSLSFCPNYHYSRSTQL